ncbi:MAG TPA: hypothetical protein VHM02_01685, partial [Thermoanaerobaculia bacterium]|nr:hypothetical protein [Thermoanaerobaculia bacterium]
GETPAEEDAPDAPPAGTEPPPAAADADADAEAPPRLVSSRRPQYPAATRRPRTERASVTSGASLHG